MDLHSLTAACSVQSRYGQITWKTAAVSAGSVVALCATICVSCSWHSSSSLNTLWKIPRLIWRYGRE